MEQKGKLVVISGFSGAGKGTLMKALLAAHPDRYALSVSATTRDPRPGEKDGVDYFFVTDETFDSMIQKDDFLEYAKYVSHSYGTPRSYVEENLNLGKNVILEIEIQGALKVKEKIKDAVLMFVTAPDAGTLRDRLVGRGTETPEVIAARLARACEESEGIENYDYFLHIHSKKSLYSGSEKLDWRKNSMNCLLGSPERVKKIWYKEINL